MADDRPPDGLESREPTVEDLRDLCRELNQRGAKYVVVGGFAIRAASYIRNTMDVDLLVAADAENEARVFAALATLPDHAARELQPGELHQYSVIRVADEILPQGAALFSPPRLRERSHGSEYHVPFPLPCGTR